MSVNINKDYKTEHEYVDLGLPSGTLWAKCNLGAKSETDFGDFYGWGMTTPYKEGIESTDIYSSSSASKIQHNLTDGEDAASVNWGNGWRMPTKTEQEELKDNCDWEWQTNYEGSGHNGYKVMKKDDHSVYIFLPAAGHLDGLSHYDVGSGGHFWSSSFHSSSGCWGLLFDSSGRYVYGDWRNYGFSVRPVISNTDLTKNNYRSTLTTSIQNLHAKNNYQDSIINFGYNSLDSLTSAMVSSNIKQFNSTDEINSWNGVETYEKYILVKIFNGGYETGIRTDQPNNGPQYGILMFKLSSNYHWGLFGCYGGFVYFFSRMPNGMKLKKLV